jgi:hypothetical protein
MISTVTIRRLGPWLVGLYVLALIGGVTPLLDEHSAHAGAPLTLSEFKSGAGAIPQDHHHAGDADDVAAHHVLQDLTGLAAWLPDGDHTVIEHVAAPSAAPRALTEADTVLLERPPKPILSI